MVVGKATAHQLTCPACKKVSELSDANVESLPTNLDKLLIIQLNKIVNERNKIIDEKIGQK